MDTNSASSTRSWLAEVFLTPEQPSRLRAGWRLLGFGFLVMLYSLLFGGVWFLTRGVLHAVLPQDTLLNAQLLEMTVFTAAVFTARRWLDRRSFISLGLTWDAWAGRDMLFGVALMGGMFTLLFVAEKALGWLQVGHVLPFMAWPPTLLKAAFLWAVVSWNEELVFRGYVWLNLKEGLNRFWAVVLSAVLFATLHGSNPHLTRQALLLLFLAGIFLALARTFTDRLWLPLGLHWGWNLFEGTVYGFPVSGFTVPRLIESVVHGPQWLTGGAFGPEGGMVFLPIVGVMTWVLYRWTMRSRPRDSA